MATTIKEIFQAECPNLKATPAFVKELMLYERQWINGREENIVYFGGVLMGTPKIVFTDADMAKWFDEVLKVDEVLLRKAIHASPNINPDFNVSSDVFNHSCFYLLHLIVNSNALSNVNKKNGAYAVLRVMHYRFITSLMFNYFPHEPKRETMEATYALMDNKFSLKQQGSWSKLIDSRAESILDPAGKRWPSIKQYNDDIEIVKSLNDIQGRIREVVKKIYKVFIDVHNNASKIHVRSSTINIDGEVHVRDLVRSASRISRYAHDVMADKRTFIRDELVDVIMSVSANMNERMLRESLEYMVDNYGERGDKRISILITDVMLHAFTFMNNNRDLERNANRFAIIIVKLKALYTSSKNNTSILMDLRNNSGAIVRRAIRTTNESRISTLRTGIMLYIVLRALAIDHYS
jgi:hypothetical protein